MYKNVVKYSPVCVCSSDNIYMRLCVAAVGDKFGAEARYQILMKCQLPQPCLNIDINQIISDKF